MSRLSVLAFLLPLVAAGGWGDWVYEKLYKLWDVADETTNVGYYVDYLSLQTITTMSGVSNYFLVMCFTCGGHGRHSTGSFCCQCRKNYISST